MTAMKALAILEAAVLECKQRNVDTTEVKEALDFLEPHIRPAWLVLSTATRSMGMAITNMIERVNNEDDKFRRPAVMNAGGVYDICRPDGGAAMSRTDVLLGLLCLLILWNILDQRGVFGRLDLTATGSPWLLWWRLISPDVEKNRSGRSRIRLTASSSVSRG